MFKKTVLCHFRNEEKMLPFWLKHHYPLFDKGIMIDYGSTDNSVKIIRELAPNWAIQSTRNELFSTYKIDQEIMDIENTIEGWKICLNITEFLIHNNLDSYIGTLLSHRPEAKGITTTGFVMLDNEDLIGKDIDPSKSIWYDRHFGYPEPDIVHRNQTDRSRLLHRSSNGLYGPGRHTNGITNDRDPLLYLLWYGWSPLHLKIARNDSTRSMLDPVDLRKGWGGHHNLSGAEILNKWRTNYLPHCSDLLDGKFPLLNYMLAQIGS